VCAGEEGQDTLVGGCEYATRCATDVLGPTMLRRTMRCADPGLVLIPGDRLSVTTRMSRRFFWPAKISKSFYFSPYYVLARE
jgi:hypothetical protein